MDEEPIRTPQGETPPPQTPPRSRRRGQEEPAPVERKSLTGQT